MFYKFGSLKIFTQSFCLQKTSEAKDKEETIEEWKETEYQKEETTTTNLMAEDWGRESAVGQSSANYSHQPSNSLSEKVMQAYLDLEFKIGFNLDWKQGT